MKLMGLVLAILLLSSCTTLDSLAGVRDDGTVAPDGGAIGTTSDFLSGLGGWGAVAGGLLGLAGSTYGAWRSRRFGRIAASLVDGCQRIRDLKGTNGKISVSEENLLEVLHAAQDAHGTRKEVEKIIKKLEG